MHICFIHCIKTILYRRVNIKWPRLRKNLSKNILLRKRKLIRGSISKCKIKHAHTTHTDAHTDAIHFLWSHSIAKTSPGYVFCQYSGRNLTRADSRGIPAMLAANLARISVAEIAPIFAKSILLRQYFACCSDTEFDKKTTAFIETR